ncbi:hypothetical protein M2399_000542, partial [Pseudomonas sp. BIGb0450]|nr:hypothetical protein [Pseudomonas sp. BIGb0450]
MTKVTPGHLFPFFTTHPELSFEDALAYASDLLHCAQELSETSPAVMHLVEMAKVMVDACIPNSPSTHNPCGGGGLCPGGGGGGARGCGGGGAPRGHPPP